MPRYALIDLTRDDEEIEIECLYTISPGYSDESPDLDFVSILHNGKEAQLSELETHWLRERLCENEVFS